MPVNTSPLAQEDIRQAMDRAVSSEKGIRITFKEGSPEANSAIATSVRARMHKLRLADRRNSTEVYPQDHPMHGQSAWDGLFIQKVGNADGSVELRLTKSNISQFLLEDL